jgi:hypothetical protein
LVFRQREEKKRCSRDDGTSPCHRGSLWQEGCWFQGRKSHARGTGDQNSGECSVSQVAAGAPSSGARWFQDRQPHAWRIGDQHSWECDVSQVAAGVPLPGTLRFCQLPISVFTDLGFRYVGTFGGISGVQPALRADSIF